MAYPQCACLDQSCLQAAVFPEQIKPALTASHCPDGDGLEVDDETVQWGAWSPCNSPYETKTLSPSDYKFQVRATDLAGNQQPDGAAYAWRVDPDIRKVRFRRFGVSFSEGLAAPGCASDPCC